MASLRGKSAGFYRRLLVVTFTLFLLTLFQNCSQSGFFSSSGDPSTGKNGGENGIDAEVTGIGTASQIFKTIAPSMAVRSANCINCHGNTMASSLITDFGHGDSYFFSRGVNGSPLSGDWVYAFRMHDTATDYKPYWAEAQQYGPNAKIIVPDVPLGFTYKTFAPTDVASAPWLEATTLPELMRRIGEIPGAIATPIEAKSFVYIGAPSVSQIRSAGRIDILQKTNYFPNKGSTLALSGLIGKSTYFTNEGTLVCDGDLFIEGTLFLKEATINTISGCRIHATGPIFIQKAIQFAPLSADVNLQLVSARLISLGIGNAHCETTTNPTGWYARSTTYSSPLSVRLKDMADPDQPHIYKNVITRNSDPLSNFEKTASSPKEEGKALYALGMAIEGLEDASCHDRNIAFEHVMMVAPQLHSRYKGSSTGVIIGEFPLFSLAAFSYTFDPVFQRVPILPKIPSKQYLEVR